jgi:hypothetical protein
MPPPKKAAKKSAKKAAKKSAGHHQDTHHQANDLRRAYEHMGRLEILQRSLKSSTADTVAELTRLAQKAIVGGHNKDAADLLRASEHLSFAVLAGENPEAGRIPAELEQSITEHFDELLRRADEHWEDQERHSSTFAGLYQSSRKSALSAFKRGAYHQALEFARAAEALAHVSQDEVPMLETADRKLQLKGA